MIIKDAKGITAEVHLYDDITGLDFVEEYLHAGGLDRDADGTYLVEDARYIDDYATEACNGSNPDFEEPLNAQWEYKELVTMKKRNIRAVVYSAKKGALPLWSGELQSMPRVYREAIIDHMFIFADASEIGELVIALKKRSQP